MKNSTNHTMVWEEPPTPTSATTTCPYHKALKVFSGLKHYFSNLTFWDKIQMAKKTTGVLTVILLVIFLFKYNCIIEYTLANYAFLKTTGLCLLALIPIIFVLKKYAPGFRFMVNLIQVGLKNYYKAFFMSFDAVKDFIVFKNFIFWGGDYLIVRNHNLAAAILQDHKTFERVSIKEKEYLPFNKYSVLGAGTGDKWLKYRKAFASYFTKEYRSDIPKVKALTERAVAQWKTKESINLLEELYNLIVEIRGEVFFQTSFGCLDNPPADENFSKIVHEVLQGPTFSLQGNPNGIVDKFHKKVFEAIQNATQPGSLGHICKINLENGKFTKQEAIQNASMFILAQAPTMVLFWVFLRAAQEGNCEELGANPVYLIQCIKEELRIHPAVPSVFIRIAQKETIIDKLNIKKGTNIKISPMFLHHHTNQWNKPEQFQPEQWKVNKADAKEILINRSNQSTSNIPPACPFSKLGSGLKYLPFGHGKHRCQGRKYAVEEIFTICQVVFQNLNLSLAKPSNLLEQPISHQTQLHVYNCPKEDVQLKIS